MAMRRFEMLHAETGERRVHYEGPFVEFALCCDALELDDNAGASAPELTSKRVTCERCLLIVRHVRGS